MKFEVKECNYCGKNTVGIDLLSNQPTMSGRYCDSAHMKAHRANAPPTPLDRRLAPKEVIDGEAVEETVFKPVGPTFDDFAVSGLDKLFG